jgi:glucose 1-dehydrogenase
MERKLEGRRTLITGASRGIGRAVAHRFAQEGACVAINYHGSREQAEETLRLADAASASAGMSEPGHFIIRADVGDHDDVERMFAELDQHFGGIDILINNAGIQIEAPSERVDPNDIERVLRTNLDGAVYCSQAALRRFLAQGQGGVILNCSSVHEIIPKPGYLGYSLSKGAMGNLTRTLALEYAGRGIRANAILPGLMDTPMIVEPLTAAYGADVEEMKRVRDAQCPLGHMGDAWDVAHAALFLASDEAKYITGTTLVVDGGLTAKYV